jgi:hypothetical protein
MQDTLRKAPFGFEKNRRNMFDPEDDDESESNEGSDSEEEVSPENEKKNCKNGNGNGREKEPKSEQAICKRAGEQDICKRAGCIKSTRFDSIFCSDACGVSTLESDLLRTFFYSSDIHPSSLRH